MTGLRLLRFACRASLPGLATITILLAAGCSGDGGEAVSTPEGAAREQPPAGQPLPRLVPAPNDLAPSPRPADPGEMSERPAFTPHWYTPSVDPLFRRLPGTGAARRMRLSPGMADTPRQADDGDDEPTDEADAGAAGVPLKDFHVIAPLLDGVASWYGPGFHGKPTASGEIYNQHRLTAAHPSLPMGTVIRVENRANGRVVWVRVNDRGPYAKGRVLDLSRAAAERLGMVGEGTAPVRIAVLRWPSTTDHDLGLRAYTQYVVQVAAYDEPEKVESLLVRMQEQFQSTPFTVDPRPNGMLSVIAGPYDKRGEAQRVARLLRDSGISSLVRRYRK